jgi:hypothetical protein
VVQSFVLNENRKTVSESFLAGHLINALFRAQFFYFSFPALPYNTVVFWRRVPFD